MPEVLIGAKNMSSGRIPNWKRSTAALLLFGISFGYVEASVVTYLSALYEPLRQRVHPGRTSSDVFPLLPLDELKAADPQYLRLLKVELARESATLGMLAAAGFLVGRSGAQWLAAFLIAFGAWDLSFYAFLKILLDWPDSWLTWDLLFLIPVPWAAPVLAPVLVSVTMIGGGLMYFTREWMRRPVTLAWLHWFGLIACGLILVGAFTWDFRNISAGGMPRPFPWPVFVFAEAVGVGTFLHAVSSSNRGR
jgi:hypothetical protein